MADEFDEGPQIIAPVDERARAILEGFRMCARSRPLFFLAAETLKH